MAKLVLSENSLFGEIEQRAQWGPITKGSDEKLATAHCVSEDFQMGKCIAVNFKLKYGSLGALMDQKVRVRGVAELKPSDEGQQLYVFYLVTKVLFHHKPTLQSLAESLLLLRDRLLDLSTNQLIIPKLGCNLDRLNWYQVRGLLFDTFESCGMMTITVCDPEHFEILPHKLKPLSEESMEIFGTSNSRGPATAPEVLVLPIDLCNASTNETFLKYLNHFNLKAK
ncbi:unnamed protein product [Macrosiphum euphorbiae]|uniref:Uncharacterized protein n=1 Tax=Macrosiphum euphorbiae TaxID=13131 RepID=A0AAV0WDJ9_9HEMI|nr:unnamed protein product [Macrosiphum euphorbiae]